MTAKTKMNGKDLEYNEEKKEWEAKSEKTEKTIFDERRKILTHSMTEKKETEHGNLEMATKGEYHEKGIKKILGDLKEKKKIYEGNIINLEKFEGEAPEMTEEMQKLKDNLEKLQMISHKEKATDDENEKNATNLKNEKEHLRKTTKDIKEITDAIGGRLKL